MKINGDSCYQMRKVADLLKECDTQHTALTGRTLGWIHQLFRAISRIYLYLEFCQNLQFPKEKVFA